MSFIQVSSVCFSFSPEVMFQCTLDKVSVYNQDKEQWMSVETKGFDLLLIIENTNSQLSMVIKQNNQILNLIDIDDNTKIYKREPELAIRYWDCSIEKWGKVQILINLKDLFRKCIDYLESLKIKIIDKDNYGSRNENKTNPTDLTDEDLIKHIHSRLKDPNFVLLVC